MRRGQGKRTKIPENRPGETVKRGIKIAGSAPAGRKYTSRFSEILKQGKNMGLDEPGKIMAKLNISRAAAFQILVEQYTLEGLDESSARQRAEKRLRNQYDPVFRKNR